MSAALLSCALVLGGGGGPLIDLIVELVGIGLLALVLAQRPPAVRGARFAYAALAIIVALPLLQLIPLPPGVWRNLAGRSLAAALADAAGAGGTRHALTLDPEATWRSLLCLVPAIAMFLSTLRADETERVRLIAITCACAATSMILGALQVNGGPAFYFYETAHYGNAVGFMINRNHHADMLLVGVALLPVLADWSRRKAVRPGASAIHAAAPWMIAALMIVMALSVITTISRAGLLLMPFVLFASLIRTFRPRRHGLPIYAGGVLIGVICLGALLLKNDVAYGTASRFLSAGQDGRYDFWIDTWYAIGLYWPAGTGLGTFIPVYASVEALERVTFNYANHAHNEYLELLLTCGAGAIVPAIGYVIAVIAALRSRVSGLPARMRGSAAIGIAIFVVHSVVDYPLRMLALLTLFGLLNGLLFAPPATSVVSGDGTAH